MRSLWLLARKLPWLVWNKSIWLFELFAIFSDLATETDLIWLQMNLKLTWTHDPILNRIKTFGLESTRWSERIPLVLPIPQVSLVEALVLAFYNPFNLTQDELLWPWILSIIIIASSATVGRFSQLSTVLFVITLSNYHHRKLN